MNYKGFMWWLARQFMSVSEAIARLATRIQDRGNQGRTKCVKCGVTCSRGFTDLEGICKDCW